MKRGCLNHLLFAAFVLAAFGFSTYLCFNFFIRGKSVSTPNLVGRSLADARAICSDLGVGLAVDAEHRRNSDRILAGNIVWQNRTPGATNLVKRGTDIRVELSAGPLVLTVPDLEGQTARTALLRLGQQNLRLGSVAYAELPGKLGAVAEEPPKGTVVPAQAPVSLLVAVAAAPPPYVMPDLIDQPLDAIRGAMERHGLHLSNVKFESYPGIADGVIIRQFPLQGSAVSGRDPITVVVSRQDKSGMIEQPGSPEALPIPPAPTATQ
jgi:Uncharacterized protein conserved in bacteria